MRVRLAGLALLALPIAGCAGSPAQVRQQPRPETCEQGDTLGFICGIDKPEDLARIPGTNWLVTSGFSKGAGLKLVDMRTRTASLWYRGRDDQIDRDPARYPDCATPPDPSLFTARGLSLRASGDGKALLHVVNHGGREAIEVFSVNHEGPQPPTLKWLGCLLMPPGHVANSVATYRDGTILATVLTRPGTTITDFVLGRVTGGVFERRPGEAAFRLLAGTELPGNNGLETARDDRGFFVIAFGLRQVVAFDRHRTSEPLWRATAPEFMPDNIHWDGDRLITAGMVRDEPACGGVRKIIDGVADMMQCHRGYVVAELDPAARTFSILAHDGPDPWFSGVSAAVIDGDALWLGSFQADRLAIRHIKAKD